MEFIIPLDPSRSLSLQQQLCEQLRHAILMGRLLPGQRLPSTRGLSQTLGISRTTVVQSYEQLLSEGYFHSKHGSGTFVCEELPEEQLHSIRRAYCSSTVKNIDADCFQQPRLQSQLSNFGASLTDTQPFEPSVPPVQVRFRFGQPDLEHLPLKQLQ
jgi:GntR family transcriptional regulator / MocR family aminotransferase